MDFDSEDPIQIRNLTKQFSNNFYAVKDLNLTIRENEIMTFLGHNGAGKTTAIYLLTGILNPTEGNAVIYGNDILNHMADV
jgi:ABC-type multidrug transport system ATPase subunit